MAEVVPKVVPGREAGGWSDLEEGASLGLFPPNTVEARDRCGEGGGSGGGAAKGTATFTSTF